MSYSITDADRVQAAHNVATLVLQYKISCDEVALTDDDATNAQAFAAEYKSIFNDACDAFDL